MKLSLLAAALLPPLALGACGMSASRGASSTPSSSAPAPLPSPPSCPAPELTPPPSPTTAPETPASDLIQATIDIGSSSAPQYSATGFGSLWVVAYRGEFIDRIDPATDKVIATIPLPRIAGTPVGSNRLVIGPHGIWLPIFESDATGSATAPNELLRIDPSTNTVALNVSIQSLAGVTDGSAGLWGSIDPRSGSALRKEIVQLDPATGRTLRIVDLGPYKSGEGYTAEIDQELGSLWATAGDHLIARIDPSSGRVTATIRTPATPSGTVVMASAAQSMFVVQNDQSLARVDPQTNCIDAIVAIGGDGITVFGAGDSVYVGFDMGALALIDPKSLTVQRSVRVTSIGKADFEGALLLAFDSMWYSTFGNDTLLRIKLLT